ncbi:MAG TPA: hypothetical protein VH593_24030 [Ktedonobacteraceae bacterium]|jgi:hypothetical protein
MNLTPEEARAALDNIRHVTTRTRNVLHSWAYLMLICGAYWTVCFLAAQFQPQPATWIEGICESIVIGMVSSAFFYHRWGKRTRLAPGSRAAFLNTRLYISYGILYGFFILWQLIFSFTLPQTMMLWITVVMCGFLLTGVWLRDPVSIGLGVGVTITSALGYVLLPHSFYLWAAIFAGLPLVGASLYYLRRR